MEWADTARGHGGDARCLVLGELARNESKVSKVGTPPQDHSCRDHLFLEDLLRKDSQ